MSCAIQDKRNKFTPQELRTANIRIFGASGHSGTLKFRLYSTTTTTTTTTTNTTSSAAAAAAATTTTTTHNYYYYYYYFKFTLAYQLGGGCLLASPDPNNRPKWFTPALYKMLHAVLISVILCSSKDAG